jgi:hypothetical protein
MIWTGVRGLVCDTVLYFSINLPYVRILTIDPGGILCLGSRPW